MIKTILHIGDLFLAHSKYRQLIDGIMDLMLETVLCDNEKILVTSNWEKVKC
ncbi:hypothetical protein [Eubacterium ramulus]|uniref:hypothetical protein n=1 Tax=Eubacterium ramulus TaxID=39490 RepID=UPI0035A2DF7D